jgi:hypothetical protein
MSLPPILEFFGRRDGVLICEGCELILVFLSIFQVGPEISFCYDFVPQADIFFMLIETLWNELSKAKLVRHKVREISN